MREMRSHASVAAVSTYPAWSDLVSGRIQTGASDRFTNE
jgi:hypothetical protein